MTREDEKDECNPSSNCSSNCCYKPRRNSDSSSSRLDTNNENSDLILSDSIITVSTISIIPTSTMNIPIQTETTLNIIPIKNSYNGNFKTQNIIVACTCALLLLLLLIICLFRRKKLDKNEEEIIKVYQKNAAQKKDLTIPVEAYINDSSSSNYKSLSFTKSFIGTSNPNTINPESMYPFGLAPAIISSQSDASSYKRASTLSYSSQKSLSSYSNFSFPHSIQLDLNPAFLPVLLPNPQNRSSVDSFASVMTSSNSILIDVNLIINFDLYFSLS